MLRVHTPPGSLLRVPEPFRQCFTTPHLRHVCVPAGRDGRSASTSHGVRHADRSRLGRGVASQPGAPVRRRRPLDMIVELRRVLIAVQYQPEVPDQPTPDEIRTVQVA